MNSKEDIAYLIRQEINKRELTIREVADSMGVSRSQVSDTVNLKNTSFERLLKLAEVFFDVEIVLKHRE